MGSYTDLPPKPRAQDAIVEIDLHGDPIYRWPTDFTYGWPPTEFSYSLTTTYPVVERTSEFDNGIFNDFTYTWRLDADVPQVKADAFVIWRYVRIQGVTLDGWHWYSLTNDLDSWAWDERYDQHSLSDILGPGKIDPAGNTGGGFFAPFILDNGLGFYLDGNEPRDWTDRQQLAIDISHSNADLHSGVVHPYHRSIVGRDLAYESGIFAGTPPQLPHLASFLFQASRLWASDPTVTYNSPGVNVGNTDELSWKWVDFRGFVVPIYFQRNPFVNFGDGLSGVRTLDHKVVGGDRIGERLTQAEIEAICTDLGFADPHLASAIAMAESDGLVGVTHLNDDGSIDYGLFQINGSAHPGYNTDLLVQDANYNAEAAFQISSGGTDWTAWVTYNTGEYLAYL